MVSIGHVVMTTVPLNPGTSTPCDGDEVAVVSPDSVLSAKVSVIFSINPPLVSETIILSDPFASLIVVV